MSEHVGERVIEGEARPDSGRSSVAAVVILGFLFASIVGMASAASPWLSADQGHSSPPAIVGEVLAVVFAAGLCVLVALMWINVPRRGKAPKPPGPVVTNAQLGSSLLAGTLVMIAGVLVVVLLALAFFFLFEQAHQSAQPPPIPVTTSDAALPPLARPPSSSSPAAIWFVVGLVASIAIVAPLALVARRRLWVTDAGRDPDDVPESVVRAVGDSIDQIERDPDARRAIIRAYAQMEHAFDDAGIPRRPSEAPFEYLGRALRGVRVSPSVAGRLAALFERARFSQHAVGTETKQEALGALREIEREMKT